MKNRIEKLTKNPKPSINGKPSKEKPTQTTESKPYSSAPFSNYAGGIPLGIDDIFKSLMALTDGWPKVISEVLCCPKKDGVRLLKNQSALFAWIRRQHPVDWKRGGSEAVPLEQFYERLLDQETEYSWASAHPHFPAVPGVYYLNEPPPAKHTGKLDQLMEQFCPETKGDRELIRALILTLYWGGAPGQRPQFVIAADPAKDKEGGRGTGKTKLGELLAELVGGCIDIQPGSNSDRIVSNLLSPSSWPRRVVLLDNLKTLHFSSASLESWITRREITGHRLFHGFATRPNLLTWMVTVNGASFSTDMARRSVVICLKRPKQLSDAWYSETMAFIEKHRSAIIADVRWHLEVKERASLAPPKEDTWADWRKGVLSRCSNPNALVERLEGRRQAIDGDKEDLADMVTHIRACLKEDKPHNSLDYAKIWIPSQVLIQWVQIVKGQYQSLQASTYLKRLPAEQFEFAHRRDGNGYWWIGSKVDRDHPPPPLFVTYRPNIEQRRGAG